MNAKTLKAHRKSRGWSQDELARRAGIARITVARLEGRAAKREPELRTVLALARTLGVPVEALIQPGGAGALDRRRGGAR
jgi:transcriptional regulator with XRE-family HTH domain